MAVPVIPQLPPAPNRGDAPADFSSKADTFVAALPPLVVNINSSLTWMGQTMTTVDGYRQAAAQSADDAQGYAGAANSSKNAAAQSATDATNNGKAQVDLAKDQVALANQARAAAQAAAAAAGAAAGLPALNGAGNVLAINSTNNGVEFTSLIPLLHATALLF